MKTSALAFLMVCGMAFAHTANTLVPKGNGYYKPKAIPDRVVLTPTENPATSMAVTWRTDTTLSHPLVIDGLKPATLYAYRVQGSGTWSEWFQFRTAASTPQPFQFLYIGDAQNQVKSHVSRMVRQAFQDLPQASMILHAGDLVNGRTNDEDNEWGE